MPRTCQPITLITLHAMLAPFALAVLPVAVIIGVPRVDDPSTADLHAYWTPADDGTDAPDPAETSGWRTRVEFALANAPDLLTFIDWLKDGCNGVTRDLSVEVVDLAADAPVPFADWLTGLEESVLVEHILLSAEVEHLALAGMATA